MTERQKHNNEVTVKRLRYTMHYAKRYSRFLETALWPDPKADWREPEPATSEQE